MAQGTTVLDQFLRLIPAELFDSLVTRYNADKGARCMTSRAQFATLAYAQVAGLVSLREIEQATAALQPMQRACGLIPARRSTLAEANLRIDWRLYRDLFHQLSALLRDQTSTQCQRVTKKLLSLDSTTIPLCLEKYPWAQFRYQKGALKIHAAIDHSDMTPVAIVVTDGRLHDIKIGRAIQFYRGETVTFDMGYFDSAWFDRLNRDGVNFVTRKPPLISTWEIESRQVNRKAGILGDWTVEFGGKPAGQYQQPLREIRYRDPVTKKELVFLSNMLNEDAEVIAEIYRQRWQIELFFKWIKQHLKIKTFLGTDENAVMTQIWIAMIVYLLLHVQWKRGGQRRTAHYLLIFIGTHALQVIPLHKAWQDFQRTKPHKNKRRKTSTSRAG